MLETDKNTLHARDVNVQNLTHELLRGSWKTSWSLKTAPDEYVLCGW